MTANQLLNRVSELAGDLGELDSDISDIKSMLRSFTGDLQPGEQLVALPADFNPSTARQQLDDILLRRHATASALREAEKQYHDTRQTEISRKLAGLRSKHNKLVIEMLKSLIDFAAKVKAANAVRSEAKDVVGPYVTAIQHIGPAADQWDLSSRNTLVTFWLQEARRAGIIDGSEDWLRGVMF